MITAFLQEWANSLGVTEPVNGSWIQAIANYYDVYEPVNGSWFQGIAFSLDVLEPVNGSWIQAIAFYYSATQLVNGNWIQAIVGGTPQSNWILNDGTWDDSGLWDDAATWEDGDVVAIYSQVVEFDTPMNSIQYRCDGEFLAGSYGLNRTDLDSLVAMFNQLPPVSLPYSNFLDYGVCYNNGDGRVRMDMYQSAYDALGCTGSLTLDVIYD